MSDEDKKDEKKDEKKKDKPPPVERTSITQHRVEIDGRTIEYTATAGTLFLRDKDDEPRAAIFYVAYTRDGIDRAARPITFAFNGGPGSSAVWLHLGILGPRRADIPDAAAPPPPPHRLVDNPQSILDVTDLVFVDPVGTGFSTPLGSAKASDFHGIKTDVESVAEFIRRYLSRHGRWNSPRFLIGESYGTTRAAGLAVALADEGIVVNGLVLVSAALMFQTFVFETGNDLPHVLYLPGYAATAAYHGVIERTPDLLEAAQAFAIERYGPALMLGSALAEERRLEIADELVRFTGLSAAWLLQKDLRIELHDFVRQLLKSRQQVVGRLDSRFTGLDPDPDAGPETQHDPSFTYPYGPYAALLNDYVHRDLGYTDERRYEIISLKVNEAWQWHEEQKRLGYVNVGKDLRRVMIQHPHLRVFFANGIYDLATPYFASMHTARHLGREPQIRANIREAFYDAGHMMYLHAPSREKMRSDLIAFYREAVPGTGATI